MTGTKNIHVFAEMKRKYVRKHAKQALMSRWQDYSSSWIGGILKWLFLIDKAKKGIIYAAVSRKPEQRTWSGNTLHWTEKAADSYHCVKTYSYTACNDTTQGKIKLGVKADMHFPPRLLVYVCHSAPVLLHLLFIFASPNSPESPYSPEKQALPQGGDTAICAVVTIRKPTVRSKRGESYLSCPHRLSLLTRKTVAGHFFKGSFQLPG